MITASTIRDLRTNLLKWREAGETVALVPTMGALHAGHMALVQQAQKMARRTVVSIFVNPLQFGASEDLGQYPRSIEEDQKLLTDAGCDLVFTPSAEEMYPQGFAVKIDPGPMGEVLEGKFRPGHFSGVATVVSKLLLQTMPDCALFGEKDYQQLLIVRQVARDLNIPGAIIGVPIVRDHDGLALSSRNVYLSADQRKQAAALPKILITTAEHIVTGKDVGAALEEGRRQLQQAGFRIDYFELADHQTLEPVKRLTAPARLLAAAHIGSTRLIDNLALQPKA